MTQMIGLIGQHVCLPLYFVIRSGHLGMNNTYDGFKWTTTYYYLAQNNALCRVNAAHVVDIQTGMNDRCDTFKWTTCVFAPMFCN